MDIFMITNCTPENIYLKSNNRPGLSFNARHFLFPKMQRQQCKDTTGMQGYDHSLIFVFVLHLHNRCTVSLLCTMNHIKWVYRKKIILKNSQLFYKL